LPRAVPAKKIFVPTQLQSKDTLSFHFFKHINENYADSNKPYNCSAISDLDFLKLGIMRCVSHTRTGHQFLQHHADHGQQDIQPSHFFKALKSTRRLANTTSINELLRSTLTTHATDPFAEFKELKSFDIYAADGHYHHAAAFDPKPEGKHGKTHATGHFFRLDLRNHHLGHIDLGVPDYGKKSAHDTTILKRSTSELLRNNAPKGRKILYAWDKACIDYGMWAKLKHNSGIYFITLEKSNSVATISSANLIDTTDPRNQGITSDHLVAPSYGEILRRITYTDPRDNSTYIYLTNELTIPAYQLVIIYKLRWNIEKVFYQLKSKMEERKSWASSETAKRHHALFECLAHNLILLMEWEMTQQGLRDEVEEKKSMGREKTRRNREGSIMKTASNYIGKIITRASHRTVRFIRWLQAALYSYEPLSESIAKLKRVWYPKKT
jgi:hypothetical protein